MGEMERGETRWRARGSSTKLSAAMELHRGKKKSGLYLDSLAQRQGGRATEDDGGVES